MTLAAETVPKPEKVIVPPPAGMTAEPEPSETLPPFTRLTVSVSPAHAAGTLLTSTCVTLPLLSTLRVELSDATPQVVTAVLPEESDCEPTARVAAAPQAAKAAAAASAVPSAFA